MKKSNVRVVEATSSTPVTAPIDFLSDAAVSALAAMLDDVPDVTVERAELEAVLAGYGAAKARAGEDLAGKRRQDAETARSRAQHAVSKLRIRMELGEQLRGELASAEAELTAAEQVLAGLNGEATAADEIVEERRQRLYEAQVALAAKLAPWRAAVLEAAAVLEDEARRSLYAAGRARYLVNALGRTGQVPHYQGLKPAPELSLNWDIGAVLRLQSQVERRLLR